MHKGECAQKPIIMDGIHTKKMVADSEAANHVRLMYEMYVCPNTSFGDIIRYFTRPKAHGLLGKSNAADVGRDL